MTETFIVNIKPLHKINFEMLSDIRISGSPVS